VFGLKKVIKKIVVRGLGRGFLSSGKGGVLKGTRKKTEEGRITGFEKKRVDNFLRRGGRAAERGGGEKGGRRGMKRKTFEKKKNL